MPSGLKRYYGQKHLHFITFSCYRRLPLLGTIRARNLFVKELDRVRREQGFRLAGYVVMPNHVHLLISEPKASNPSQALQVLKQQVSRTLRKKRRKPPAGQLLLNFAGAPGEEEHFWQRRFYDFNAWSERKFWEKLEYMHANPVKRGLVLHPKDWPWSSWVHYVRGEEGLIRIDSMEKKTEKKRNQGVEEKKN